MTKQRILQYIEFKGISRVVFFQSTDIKRGLLDADKMNATVSDVVLAKILVTYPDLNIEWLITGKGEMLKKNAEESQITEDNSRLWALIESQARTIESQQRTIEVFAQKGGVGAVPGAASTGGRG